MLAHRKDNKDLLVFMQEQVSSLSSRIGRLEGRSEELKEELTAVLQLELLKVFQGGLGAARPKAFLDDGEPKA